MCNGAGLHFVVLLSLIGIATAESSINHDYFKYNPMTEVSNWMAQIAKTHPDVVTIVEYGKTYEKRTISLLKIGVKSEAKKKAIWMDCGIHAREWIAPAFCQYFVKEILQAYKTDPKMQQMMTNMDFYVTPVLNIDGYIHSWTTDMDNIQIHFHLKQPFTKSISHFHSLNGRKEWSSITNEFDPFRMWRKNMSPGPYNCSCNGTDLNRNFDANWGTIGVSTDCCSNIYCGTQPVSEPEAQAVTYFVGSRIEDFLCFLTIHSYGQLLLLPYGHPNFTASNYDELMEVGNGAAEAIRKVHGMRYTVGTSPDVLYPNSGSSRDWARLKGIPFAYTFELRDNGTFGFKLPENQIQPTCEEAYSGALHIITYAHDKTFNSAVATVAATLWTVLSAAAVTGNNLM